MKEQPQLRDVIQAGRRLIIFLHDNPDPDAIASGWILKKISEHLGVSSRIVYDGRLGRAENRAMARLLPIPIRNLRDGRLRYLKNDRFALVDTQPGTGNNSFPHIRLDCHIVIDHHPRLKSFEADFIDVRPEVGCCTTILLDYLFRHDISIDANLATACAYAIISETQDLDREATRQDREAFLKVFPHARLRILGKIRHPAHSRDYYRTVARAMRHVMVSKNTCVCHAGQVSAPELVAELADFLVSMERSTWCLVSGYHEKEMALSIRTTNPRGRAERVMKRILGDFGKGGGHGMIAGGLISCEDGDVYQQHATQITERFMKVLRRGDDRLRRLIGAEDDFSVEEEISRRERSMA